MKKSNKGYTVILPRWVDRCPQYFQNYDDYCTKNGINSITEGLESQYNVAVEDYAGPIEPDEINCIFETEEDFIMFKMRWS